MKILIDENLPHRLRGNLGSHETWTVRYRGWAGLRNGALLQAAEQDDFDVFITGDQTLVKEQNLNGRRLSILVLTAIEWHFVSRCLRQIQSAIEAAEPGSLHILDCGTFTRKDPQG